MYQTTQALQMSSSYTQHERLHEAATERMAREVPKASHVSWATHFTPFQRRMVTVAVAVGTVLGVVALI